MVNQRAMTAYFAREVLRKRPYIKLEWCRKVIANPILVETQEDGRVRYWGEIEELGGRVLRVVTLKDGYTLHNAFPDRNFRR